MSAFAVINVLNEENAKLRTLNAELATSVKELLDNHPTCTVEYSWIVDRAKKAVAKVGSIK